MTTDVWTHKAVVLASVLCVWCAMPTQVLAKERLKVRKADQVGLGVGLGMFSIGFSGKYYLDEHTSVQATLGTKLDEPSARGTWLAFGADYLFEMHTFGQRGIDLGWFAGPGVGLSISDRNYWEAGVAGVLGFAILFDDVPLDVAFEYRPSIRFGYYSLINPIQFEFANFGVHMRYFF